METMNITMTGNAYAGGISSVLCATPAAVTSVVRGAATRDERTAAKAIRTWDGDFTGAFATKRAGLVPAHNRGSLAWSPPL